MSCELTAEMSPSYGIPSTTYNGLLLAYMEPIPRIRTVAFSPGCPFVLCVCTPDTVPESAFDMFETWRFSRVSDFITEAEPVNADFLAVP